MSDEAIALALMLSLLERLVVAAERIADAIDTHADYFEAANAPSNDG
jgi:hypothetical protein